jgi:hypothetical protein
LDARCFFFHQDHGRENDMGTVPQAMIAFSNQPFSGQAPYNSGTAGADGRCSQTSGYMVSYFLDAGVGALAPSKDR